MPTKAHDPHNAFNGEDQTMPTTASSDSSSLDSERLAEEMQVLERAKAYLKPGRLFHIVNTLYAERKLVVVVMVHIMATIIIWTHYGLIKWQALEQSVPQSASYYWAKRSVPPILFGSKHAILLQLALIPLTMSRYSIAALSDSVLERYIPLDRALRMHVILGYTMVGLVVFATFLFVSYFGVLCSGGEQDYCSGLTSEIMLTGIAITVLTCFVAVTSHVRNHMPYEIFYACHHLVFVLYIMTVLHTVDGVQRSGMKQRYQTFPWVTATLLFYLCDRAIVHMVHKYRVSLASSSIVDGRSGSNTVILKFRRPVLFTFRPGQYAFLRLSNIDNSWHPFSIASGPASPCLEFYIEVFGKDSWTRKLSELLKSPSSGLHLQFDVMGPYGTSLGNADDYSHAVVVGSGTGIVPILSMFKQHARQLVHLDPDAHFENLKRRQRKIIKVEKAEQLLKGSVASKLLAWSFGTSIGRSNRRDKLKRSIVESMKSFEQDSRNMDTSTSGMKKAAYQASRSIYGVVILTILPVIGVSLIGWTISWNTFSDQGMYLGMSEFLVIATVAFQAFFAAIALFIWDANELAAYIDVVVSFICPLADWYIFRRYTIGDTLDARMIALYSVIIFYMTARFWNMAVRPRHRSWRKSKLSGGFATLDRLEFVWVTRHASQAAEILPELNRIFEGLTSIWGQKRLDDVCRLQIYVTDKDKTSLELLRREITAMALYKKGSIFFQRPDFESIIENHSLDMISNLRNSSSLLAFCGSSVLSRAISEYKIQNDMLKAMTGNKKHQMEFVSEAYGGASPNRNIKPAPPSAPPESAPTPILDEESPLENLTTRTQVTHDTQNAYPSAEIILD